MIKESNQQTSHIGPLFFTFRPSSHNLNEKQN